jgi:dTDP-4-dehydrorhamnose reductase
MILITGASGILGASLVALAQEQGREVAGLYHRHAVHLPGATMLAADLTEESEVEKIFDEVRPESVIHCAAATDVDWCEENPEEAHSINVAASARIAGRASRIGARLLYVSTDSVFDGIRGRYAESDRPMPLNVYARTKLEGEQVVLDRNSSAAIARVTLYGWRAKNKPSLAEWILEELAAGGQVPGFSDVIFCPILANDLAEVLLAMVDGSLRGLYHVAGSEPVSKYEFARRVALTFGYDPARVVDARIAGRKVKAVRPRDTSLITEKICAALGRAMPDVDSGLRKFARLKADGYVDRLRGHQAGVQDQCL